MLEKSTPILLDEKQLITDIQDEKINYLDLAHTFIKEKKAEAKNTATLQEHGSDVCALTALPDGRLASGSADNTIKLWDVKSGACQAILLGHSDSIMALTVLPDGRLASGSADSTIKLWDMKSGTCQATLSGHNDAINTLTVLPDGRLASGSDDKTIKLWDAKSGACQATLSEHSDSVNALAILPDGRLASGSIDKTIKLWDAKSGTCQATCEHKSEVSDLTALLDGRLASAGYGDKTIKIWEIKSNTCQASLYWHNSPVLALAVLPDGGLASGSWWDNTINLWAVESGSYQAVLLGHNGNVCAFTVLSDGRLASGSRDKTVKLWDICLRPVPLPILQKVLAYLENNSSVHKVNLQHTALNDGSLAGLAKIFQTNRTVTELHMASTQVTAKGAWDFYNALPPSHPLRGGLHHEAMFTIYCKEVLGRILPRPLISLMMAYVSPEEAKYLNNLDKEISTSAQLLADAANSSQSNFFNANKRKREDSDNSRGSADETAMVDDSNLSLPSADKRQKMAARR